MNRPIRSYLRFAIILTVVQVLATEVLSQTVTPTKGTDFWLGFMRNYDPTPGESLDLFIVSDVATTGTVSVPGQAWSQNFTVQPNTTTTVSIPTAIGEVMANQIITSKGVHISTQDTVAVFAISFNPYSADGTKILPTPTLGTHYMVASYAGVTPWDSELLIVATEDGTEVEITPRVTTSAGNPAGVPFTVTLNEGECYQVASAPGQDLTGTVVKATEASGSCRPFAVFSGAGCTNIPFGCIACDHIFEQNFPVDVWGTDYFIPPFVFVLNPSYNVSQPNYTYRILASENATSVSVDGAAPIVLQAGQYQEFNFQAGPRCIQSNKPIACIQYMQGISCGGNGDPAMLILDDISKKIDNITFSTVQSNVITTHYLNVVIDATDLGNVTLDGNVINPTLFQPFPGCPGQLWAGFQIAPGSHTLDAPGGGVTGYVYGNGDAESYAYSVGSFSPVPPMLIEEAFCTSSAVSLQLPNGLFNPYWYNVTNPDVVLHQGLQYNVPVPVQNGIYVGVGSEFVSGCEESFYYSVEVPVPPSISLTPDNTTICRYESVQLNVLASPASAVYEYVWTPTAGLSNSSIPNPVASPLETTTYTVSVTTPTGCAVNTASVTLTVLNGRITRFDASPESTQTCQGQGVEMEVTTELVTWSDDFNPGVSWGDWTSILNGAESAVCGSVSGNALYFNGNGERSATTLPISCVNGGTVFFSLKIANGVAPCDNAEPGDNVLLEYSLDGVNFTLIQTYYESAYPDFLAIEQTIPQAAQSPATYFRWRQVGVYAAGQDNWVLDDCFIGVLRTEDFVYTWTPDDGLSPSTGTPVWANPEFTTVYQVTMIDPMNGCDYVDEVQVYVGQPYGLQVSEDMVLCDVQGVQLQAIPDQGDPAAYTYSWTPTEQITGASTATPVVTPVESTVYHVLVANAEGCTQEADVDIVVSALLELDVETSHSLICEGDTVSLFAIFTGSGPDVMYGWVSQQGLLDSEAPETMANPQQSVTYTFEVTHVPSGCVLSESVSIEVLPSFTITTDPAQLEHCHLAGMTVSGVSTFTGPLTWNWFPGDLVADAQSQETTLLQDSSAVLTLMATNAAGCSATAELTISFLVETTDLGPDLQICSDNYAELDTGWSDDYSFTWSTGDTGPSIIIVESGVYSVEVVSPIGCVSADEIAVDVYPFPEVELGPSTAHCEGAVVLLDAGEQEGVTYLWSNGATSRTIGAGQTGTYTVTVSNGVCEASDEVFLFFNPSPERSFGRDTLFCFGFPPFVVGLDAGNEGYTYSWSTGESTQSIEANAPGLYSVVIRTDFGCEGEFDIVIDEDCPGSIYIPNAFTPDGDGINDGWRVQGDKIAVFHVKVWNRWGELFYESSEVNKSWWGQRRNNDRIAVSDAYVYRVVVQFELDDGTLSDEMEFNGHISLVR